VFVTVVILVLVVVLDRALSLPWRQFDGRSISWCPQPGPAKGKPVDEVLSALGYLMPSAESSPLEVLSEQRSDSANRRLVSVPITPRHRAQRSEGTGRANVHNLVLVLEDLLHLLKMQALVAAAKSILTGGPDQLDGVVLEPPLAALEGHYFVDLREELRDAQVGGGAGARPNELDVRDAVALDRDAQPERVLRHDGGMLRLQVHGCACVNDETDKRAAAVEERERVKRERETGENANGKEPAGSLSGWQVGLKGTK